MLLENEIGVFSFPLFSMMVNERFSKASVAERDAWKVKNITIEVGLTKLLIGFT